MKTNNSILKLYAFYISITAKRQRKNLTTYLFKCVNENCE